MPLLLVHLYLSHNIRPSQREIESHAVCDDESHSCRSLFALHPTLYEDCVKQPELPLCSSKCADSPSSGGALRRGTSSSIWPPLERPVAWQDSNHHHTPYNILDRYTYHPETTPPHDVCSILRQRNISDIKLVGDSLMRHLWQGLTILFQDDPHYHFESLGPQCIGSDSFWNQKCKPGPTRGEGLNITVCDGSVHLHYQQHLPRQLLHQPALTQAPRASGHTWLLYGVGNHPPNADHRPEGRLGILNTTAWRALHWDAFPKEYFGTDDLSVVWVPPHYKLSINSVDQTNERALEFLYESAEFFAAHGVPTLNTYSLTRSVVPYLCRSCNYPEDPLKLKPNKQCTYHSRETGEPTIETWDGFHYGLAVNYWKAHLLVEYLRHMVPPQATK